VPVADTPAVAAMPVVEVAAVGAVALTAEAAEAVVVAVVVAAITDNKFAEFLIEARSEPCREASGSFGPAVSLGESGG